MFWHGGFFRKESRKEKGQKMGKFVCTVCGFVYEGDAAPDECPVCHQPASKFREEPAENAQAGDLNWRFYGDKDANAKLGRYLAFGRAVESGAISG